MRKTNHWNVKIIEETGNKRRKFSEDAHRTQNASYQILFPAQCSLNSRTCKQCDLRVRASLRFAFAAHGSRI
jgi:hypothetical protein